MDRAQIQRIRELQPGSLLAPLSETQRVRLVTAMGEAERLMQASAVKISAERAASADAQWCLEQYFHELSERFDEIKRMWVASSAHHWFQKTGLQALGEQ